MGLDMYLSVVKDVSGYKHRDVVEQAEYVKVLDSMDLSDVDVCDDVPSAKVTLTVAYWRKSNAIHKWFVENCQDGVDECQSSYVERKQLQELAETCQQVLENPEKSNELLPTGDGFFFGSSEYDDYYREDIRNTAITLRRILKNPKFDGFSFEYRASW